MEVILERGQVVAAREQPIQARGERRRAADLETFAALRGVPQRELVADVVVRRAPQHLVINVFQRCLKMLVGAEVFERSGCCRADDEPAEREHSAGLPSPVLARPGCPH